MQLTCCGGRWNRWEGKGKKMLCERHVQRRALGMFGHLKKVGVAGTGWGQQGPPHAVPPLNLQSSDRLCASVGPWGLSRLRQEMEGNLSLDSHTDSFLRLMPLIICVLPALFFPSFAIVALFQFREGKHTFQEAWIIPWYSAPGHKSIQCFWGRSLESKAKKTEGGLAAFYPLK